MGGGAKAKMDDVTSVNRIRIVAFVAMFSYILQLSIGLFIEQETYWMVVITNDRAHPLSRTRHNFRFAFFIAAFACNCVRLAPRQLNITRYSSKQIFNPNNAK